MQVIAGIVIFLTVIGVVACVEINRKGDKADDSERGQSGIYKAD
jgi:hypothetical protein